MTTAWTWLTGQNGAATAAANANFGTQGTAALANSPPPLNGSAMWSDSSGNIWVFGGADDTGANYNALWEYSP